MNILGRNRQLEQLGGTKSTFKKGGVKPVKATFLKSCAYERFYKVKSQTIKFC